MAITMKLEELRPFTQEKYQSSHLKNIPEQTLQEVISYSEQIRFGGGALYGLGIGFLIASGMVGLETSEAISFVSASAVLMFSGKKYYESGSRILKKSSNIANANGFIIRKRIMRRKLTEISQSELDRHLLPESE